MALHCTMAVTVETHRKAGTITSSPGPICRADIVVHRAPVPLLTARACLTP